MASESLHHVNSFATHSKTCPLHESEKNKLCSGKLRKGGQCINKALPPFEPWLMPTCKVHRDQTKYSTLCRAVLECGFRCGRSCEFKVHENQLCPEHLETPMSCYFLKIPIELRFRIYGYLLPDMIIPAQLGRGPPSPFGMNRSLKSDGEPVCTSILRVNHQIHDESTSILYGSNTFTINLNTYGLVMLGKEQNPENLALQDYQAQLMLFEQQNIRRRLMQMNNPVVLPQPAMSPQQAMQLAQQQAQQQQTAQQNMQLAQVRAQVARNNMAQLAFTSFPVQPQVRQGPVPVTNYYQPSPGLGPYPQAQLYFEPIWTPSVDEKYFRGIHSFLVEINLVPSMQWNNGPMPGNMINGISPPGWTNKNLETQIYGYCDHLHRLVKRLLLSKNRISSLEVSINFHNTSVAHAEVFDAARILLEPLKHLKARRANLLSINVADQQGRTSDLLQPHWVPSPAYQSFDQYLGEWNQALTSPEPAREYTPIFEAYWQIDKLVSTIMNHPVHPFNRDQTLGEFPDLLHAAKIAREAENVTGFGEIWERVVNIWIDHLSAEKAYHESVANSISSIYDLVKNDD
ncbi:hypothetical protein G7Y89_g4192 [Cudoniella acicularis]|uniref:Uncharacterized protein n=1 Tax=Cudoniella acicularis TaxID=354080 RepID=A0A8H4RRC5_9HELO|nr:hypothetical protein G7Y89_g4192 [Cudoniella acicularis]